MIFSNEIKKNFLVVFCFFVTSIVTLNANTFILLPLEGESQKEIFSHINSPVNFLAWAQTPGQIPINPIEINPQKTYVIIDINNSLTLIDEQYSDAILNFLHLEKKVMGGCTGSDLLNNTAHLYHPTGNRRIPFIPGDATEYNNALSHALDQGTFELEKKLVIVITSYNNKDWYKKNLDAAFMQKYTNYRIIYIDDRSPDGTGKLVQTYIKENGQDHRTTLVLQSEWKSQMANHYYAVYMCDDDEIVCHYDGDDWLYNDEVLKTINEIYLYQDIWITYGLPIDSLGNRPPRPNTEIMKKVIERNTYRTEECWGIGHLRTFYVWLFKSLKLQDLVYKGNFANMSPAPDVAMMYPMLEMGGFHTKLTDRDLYVVNKKNPISQCNITPYRVISELDRTIKSKWPPYEPLYRPIVNRISHYEHKKADVILWVEQVSLELFVALQAIKTHLRNSENVFIVYEKSCCSEKDLAYLKLNFPECKFLDYDSSNTHFSSILKYLINQTGDYVVFTGTDFVLERDRDISQCIKELERTFAYGFYLHLNYIDELKKLHAPLSDEISAWQPEYTKDIWPNPNTLGMILYRKKDIERYLQTAVCRTVKEFKELWAHLKMPERAVGLFFNY